MTATVLQGLGTDLPDLCTEFFAFVLQLSQAQDPGDGEQLRARINGMLGEIHTRGTTAGLPPEALMTARYALIALVDELIMTSNWGLKGAWLGRPLQMEHFNNFAAGEEFYTRLDAVRAAADPRKGQLLEVFYLCLCFGFKGKHGGVQGINVLQGLKTQLVAEIEAVGGSTIGAPAQSVAVSTRDVALKQARRKSNTGDLSPSWRAPHHALELPKELPVRAVVVACVSLTVIVYIVLASVLASSVSGILGTMG